MPAAALHPSVFISYSRADLVPVRALAMALRRQGLGTWMDLDDLLPGQRWKEAIGRALAAADAMVFCMSPLSLESRWTEVEVDKARALAKPIVPVAIERVALEAVPAALHDLHVHDMSRHPPRHAATLTARGIAAALGVPPAGALAAEAMVDVVVVAMEPAARGGGGAPGACGVVEHLDFSDPGRVRLADLAQWAGHARRAELRVGPGSDDLLVGLVLGTLCQAFGRTRVRVLSRGPASDPLRVAALAAGVELSCP